MDVLENVTYKKDYKPQYTPSKSSVLPELPTKEVPIIVKEVKPVKESSPVIKEATPDVKEYQKPSHGIDMVTLILTLVISAVVLMVGLVVVNNTMQSITSTQDIAIQNPSVANSINTTFIAVATAYNSIPIMMLIGAVIFLFMIITRVMRSGNF
jgi:hypothetical protein